MKIYRIIVIIGVLLLIPSALCAQDFLQKTKNYLDAGECEKAQRAYNAYRVENPRNYDVEQRIEDCKTIKDKTFSVNGVSFKMIFVQGGTFQMGSNDKDECDCVRPVHDVTVSSFYMGEFEVTQELFGKVMGTTIYQQRDKANTKYRMAGVGSYYPMYYVSYNEVQEFCRQLNQLLVDQLPTGYRFALPSEAEWEYAARGGNKSRQNNFAGSNDVAEVAFYEENADESTHVVGSKSPNELGLYDMSGNVGEWCEDNYSSTFYKDNHNWINPVNIDKGNSHVVRGCSFFTSALGCHVSWRFQGSDSRASDVGFRLALVRRKINVNVPKGYVDLGLPSGTFWKFTDEEGFYNYDEAKRLFGNKMPSMRQWKELIDYCAWIYFDDKTSVMVQGPNGNRITLHFKGQRIVSSMMYGLSAVGELMCSDGFYWSSTSNSSSIWTVHCEKSKNTINEEIINDEIQYSIHLIR